MNGIEIAPSVVPGDVNGDGEVTASDVTALYNHLLTGDDSALVNGDQDGDGNITAGDVTFVYNILLGINK
ncbi:MAG: dockerin type I repeat-containing protein [Muribaculaceae bacterium]|nr:dockerin type I repeat-containing protein [Muribaculaceae bacterium]